MFNGLDLVRTENKITIGLMMGFLGIVFIIFPKKSTEVAVELNNMWLTKCPNPDIKLQRQINNFRKAKAYVIVIGLFLILCGSGLAIGISGNTAAAIIAFAVGLACIIYCVPYARLGRAYVLSYYNKKRHCGFISF